MYIFCIYSFMYWKSVTSDLLVLILFVLQCTTINKFFFLFLLLLLHYFLTHRGQAYPNMLQWTVWSLARIMAWYRSTAKVMSLCMPVLPFGFELFTIGWTVSILWLSLAKPSHYFPYMFGSCFVPSHNSIWWALKHPMRKYTISYLSKHLLFVKKDLELLSVCPLQSCVRQEWVKFVVLIKCVL